ncbi:hypothetical protein [Curtobacterium sp. VKM Ac-1395]|uniref:hypothetical protein n=1 Tax=Curtobacterium sp. VKM Ac-1395 TaxID=2783815 RepID=UPI001E39F6B5|nr:hypothetical protein [Curtobacterium sp. VKM Ac-1395]
MKHLQWGRYGLVVGTVFVVENWRRDRIGSALRGENPTVLRRLTASFAVIGDV